MMSRLLLVFCVLVSTERFVRAQFPYLGKCPELEVQKDFDIEKFSGRWYEIERTMSLIEIGSQCVTTNFSDTGYGDGSVEVVNEGLGPVLKLRKSVRLVATLPDKNEPAKLSLRLSDLSLKTHYWILSTDYDNYAIIFACNHIWLTFKYARTENLWILGREREIPEDVMEKVHQRIDAMKDIRVKKATQESKPGKLRLKHKEQ